MHSLFAAPLAGFAFGLSLIVAIGAQNAFVLRQGLARRHVLAVVGVCAVSDLILITAGVAGAGLLTNVAPGLVKIAFWGGALFLVLYAAVSARRAFRPASLTPNDDVGPTRLGTAVVTAMALTWLNPHVYLDTVFLLGSVAATYEAARVWFGVGAAAASVVWFSALGYGARLLRPAFSKPSAWRVLDGAIAAFMLALGIGLAAQAVNN
ncbi:LysE/ArgO family amino acid transporter [Rhodococcus sp. G-MC3]|uniref:LysE/ArgO family amino acid transporter n=1 Tax=Rhodococcus sp. G-MC3 TaxID=3046209 RepID=UPI0024BA72A0|nr:LysE/ArgO family amino acid transporter [Rhodococcus sp. G-MC3]MDJ0392982.1 LysE/ArgO family amino acid transporter [Rhodococcus sp. G-MC3]